ncbi:helicase-exonuclease AddAB subunit AddA [Bacillus sp. FJAT-42315]|uniref:helicase-exonuclease AddAB subunit AddA n=1 Tax=Bacillus sp. FJAT-42315 TaxID=2014077 RepID=UPI000C234DAE|nr:helicase-exonuclease AddAB subunit AddA [Bacillus sp. FJAT-42315]
MSEQLIPEKPAGVTWTDDQWKAITATGTDILVAAAAGSGKTAVLVERIIRKVLNEDEPIDIDELLVVTFTNAAAAEMRHRIGLALEKAMESDPTSKHLRKQLSLLNKASISTLHSFCLEVIRKYYYLIDIDPSFRIADEAEGLLLRDEALDDLFEEEYGKEGNEDFYRLVDTFSSDRSDAQLQMIVGRLYDFAKSHPQPEEWLHRLPQLYDVDEETTNIDDLPFMEALKFDIELQLEGAELLVNELVAIANMSGGPSPRMVNFIADQQIVQRLRESISSWRKLYEEMQTVKFSTLKTCKGEEYDQELVDKSKDVRNELKKIITSLKEDYFSRKPESYLRDMREMRDIIASLAQLVCKFTDKFQAMKREKGLVDFGDLEHFALAILAERREGEGELIPSEAALLYQKKFKEVLLDEYQDVNFVQESIIRLVTSGAEEKGNLFMVGDVKQSIYRFRLAEPNLFLSKYRRFSTTGEHTGMRIDLAKNFRSRQEVLDGTNYLFKQIMGVKVGEIEYDPQAELVKGADYPEEPVVPVEVTIIEQEGAAVEQEDEVGLEDAEQSQLEARWIVQKIKELVQSRYPVYDPKTKTERPIQYRDIVILLRSMPWAGEIMEEGRRSGVPIYAKLSGGYFQATEVVIMLSLLKVIDNPYQDIPLASVLRSPIVNCSENDLATIRLASKKGTYYDAVQAFAKKKPAAEHEAIHEKINKFLEKLSNWRTISRNGALSSLIWQLYRDTHFYDFAGGMPGGKQRQANLRALYDRAKQYEETSFRGLFRFLRLIERIQERGDDLGEAKALNEQEDVVRLMTIHASKGLEFPVVFVAGLGRQFNLMDIRQSYLFDKDYGIAAKYTNIEKRISYPSLPQLALRRKKRLELLAEEMRVLYVALTRAKEKLFLLGTQKNADKSLVNWEKGWSSTDWLLSDTDRAAAISYFDWIGPALVRHREWTLSDHPNLDHFADIHHHASRWKIEIVHPESLLEPEQEVDPQQVDWQTKVENSEPIAISSPYKQQIIERMSWQYSNPVATKLRSKQSVSDLKRMNEIYNEGAGNELVKSFQRPIFSRPAFMQEKALSPAEVGTAVHTVMQHVPLHEQPTEADIHSLLEELIQRELLTSEQAEVIDPHRIVSFFETEVGQMLLRADHVYRETPFNMGVKASELHTDWSGSEEIVLVQGVIDCLIDIDGQLYLLDYKTDQITGRFAGGFDEARPVLEERYRIQIDLYAKAIEQIWKRKIVRKYLFFFDGAHALQIE